MLLFPNSQQSEMQNQKTDDEQVGAEKLSFQAMCEEV